MIAPVVAAYTKAYPKHKVSVLTKKQFAPLFAHLSSVEVIPVDFNIDYKGVFGLIRLSKIIKTLKIDAIAKTDLYILCMPILFWVEISISL